MSSDPLPAPNCSTSFTLPDLKRAERIGEFWGHPRTRAFGELLIDLEGDRTLRAVLVGMLREADREGVDLSSGKCHCIDTMIQTV